MIVLDSSAIIAIIIEENDAQEFLQVVSSGDCIVSAASVLECTLVATRLGGRGLEALIDVFILENGIVTIDVDTLQLKAARVAFRLYGKGQGHPAKLNFGDCFPYALAKTRDMPLLFKGDDFSQTDIISAL